MKRVCAAAIALCLSFGTAPGAEVANALPPGYGGTQSCKECHEKEYNQFIRSPHRKYVQAVSPDTVIGDFTTNNVLEAGGGKTTMVRRGDQFFVRTLGPDGAVRDYRCERTIGHRFKQRYSTTLDDGRRYVLPVQWNKNQQRWVDYHGLKGHRPGDGGYWSDPGRAVAVRCAGCHGTGVSLKPDADGRPHIVEAEFTIGCEACHGPCADHNEDEKNPAILQRISLKGLSQQRQTDVCGKCHSRGTDPDHGTHYPLGFLPGDRVLRRFELVEPTIGTTGKNFWADGRARKHHQQFTEFVQSKHYTRASMTCIACHTNHERKTDGMLNIEADQHPNAVCTQCHEDLKGDPALKDHTFHDAADEKEREGTVCADCHMPTFVRNEQPMQLRHHGASIPNPRKTQLWGTPNACNMCHDAPAKNDTPQRMIDKMTEWGIPPMPIEVKVRVKVPAEEKEEDAPPREE